VLEQYLTTRQMAERLNYHPDTIRRLANRGVIPSERLGNGKILYPEDKVRTALRSYDRQKRADRRSQFK